MIKSNGPLVAAAVALQTDFINVETAVQRLTIDSKAMRKFTEGESFYVALEVTLTGTAVLNWQVDSRMLFKLP